MKILHISLIFCNYNSSYWRGKETDRCQEKNLGRDDYLAALQKANCLHCKQARIKGVKSCSQSSDYLHIDLGIYTEHGVLNFDKNYF